MGHHHAQVELRHLGRRPNAALSVNVARPIPSQRGPPSVRRRAALLRPQRGVADGRQQPVERRGVVAGVVDEPGRRRIWERCGGYEVAAPDLGGVHAGRDRHMVDDALDRVAGFRAPGAPVRRHRRGVGEYQADARLVAG
jgi:hypothetical protein